jgi:hypothetical protein
MPVSASQIPFNPLGDTVVIAADSTAPEGVQVAANVPTPLDPGYAAEYRVVNAGDVTVHLGVGTSAAAAQTAAVAATAGSPAAGIPLVAGAVEVLRFAPGAYFSGKAASATTVYITPGQGL